MNQRHAVVFDHHEPGAGVEVEDPRTRSTGRGGREDEQQRRQAAECQRFLHRCNKG
ncbi:MAG: hypothetical protein Q9Q13_02635 [Acidobacteriota bacterium]|nr:hypothetical protein [Acidobacteriota bacterium]